MRKSLRSIEKLFYNCPGYQRRVIM